MAGLGEFEQVVLLAILRLSENAYAVTITDEIKHHTGRSPSPGALYTTLDRLEEKGFVRCKLGEPTSKRGGRAKRLFTVTRAGTIAIARAQQSYRSLAQGLQLPEWNRA